MLESLKALGPDRVRSLLVEKMQEAHSIMQDTALLPAERRRQFAAKQRFIDLLLEADGEFKEEYEKSNGQRS